MIRRVVPVFKREFLGYFRSVVAYVYLIGFLMLSIGLAFFVGQFFKANQASMDRYFMFYPWVFIFLIPAVGMRLWCEEMRSGSIELLFTLPVTVFEAVLGKFLAAWAFLVLAICLSFPMAITIGYLGAPDWGIVATGYLGGILMAGAYLGISALASTLTKNQAVSFVIAVVTSAVLLFLGWSVFGGILSVVFPVSVVDALTNFGFLTHFERLAKGIIDSRDIVYFLSLVGFTLFLSVISLERQRIRSIGFAKNVLFGALLSVSLVLTNYVASSLPVQFDATSERIYTLSSGSTTILSRIDEPITIEFYCSLGQRGLNIAVKNYTARVHEMLHQYVKAAHGKITLRLIETEADTSEEVKAVAVGIRAQRIQVGSEPFYLGLVATQADQRRALPALTPNREQFLEYDISELIYSVQQTDKKKLGLVSGVPLQGDVAVSMARQETQDAQCVAKGWMNTYEILPVATDATDLPPGIDALAVVCPEGLEPSLQFAIDQFLLSGKPVFLAVDPSSQYFKRQYITAMKSGTSPPNVSSDLPALIKGWGLVYDSQKIVGDTGRATNVKVDTGTVMRDPIWLTIQHGDINAQAPPTAQLNRMLFIESGSVSLKPGTPLTFVPLVETSVGAGELASQVQFAIPDQIASRIIPSGKKTIAALVTGKFMSAFPDGPPQKGKADAGSAAKVEQFQRIPQATSFLGEANTSSTLIIVCDTDWLLDSYSVRKSDALGTIAVEPLNDNLAFAANSLDFLSGSRELISIRGKGNSLRSFTVVQSMEVQANREYQEKLPALESELSDLQAKLAKLGGMKDEGNGLVTTPEATDTIRKIKEKEAVLRNNLRIIRLELHRGIDALENRLLVINLFASPLLVCIGGALFQRARKS